MAVICQAWMLMVLLMVVIPWPSPAEAGNEELRGQEWWKTIHRVETKMQTSQGFQGDQAKRKNTSGRVGSGGARTGRHRGKWKNNER